MTEQPDQRAFQATLPHPVQAGLLRIVVCGSVDHGKSTLLGRLLYEANALFEDQIAAVQAASRKLGGAGGEIDFSLLLDGLAAEREQKITIDVAYRYFATPRRKFIIADTPGHEQYTRNMATGASNADVALILVSASSGLTAQTRRHGLIAAMLGVRHFVVAVNKMDLVDRSEVAFRRIETEFRGFAASLGVETVVCIPVAARDGDNIVSGSESMPWYTGPTVLAHLEQAEAPQPADVPGFRLPVQWVNRPDADFRGYSGLVTSGSIAAGTRVRILPSGQTATVARIVTYDGDLDRASAGQSVTLTLAEEVDASRGDVIASIEETPTVTDRIAARIVWMGEAPLAPGGTYLLKLGTMLATARLEAPVTVVDLDTGAATPTDRLLGNEVGTGLLQLDRAIAVDDYRRRKATGSFILIDPESFDTVGMGLVALDQADEAARPVPLLVRLAGARGQDPSGETHLRSIAKALSWRGTAGLDTFLIAWLITGNAAAAGGITLIEFVTKIGLYYGHERVWSWVSWGRPQHARPGQGTASERREQTEASW